MTGESGKYASAWGSGYSTRNIYVSPVHAYLLAIKLITAQSDIERAGFFESHQGCERGRRTGSDSPRGRYGGQERGVQGSLLGLEDGPGDRGEVRGDRFGRPPVLREDETRGDEVADGSDRVPGEGVPRVLLLLSHQRDRPAPRNLGRPPRRDDVRR